MEELYSDSESETESVPVSPFLHRVEISYSNCEKDKLIFNMNKDTSFEDFKDLIIEHKNPNVPVINFGDGIKYFHIFIL